MSRGIRETTRARGKNQGSAKRNTGFDPAPVALLEDSRGASGRGRAAGGRSRPVGSHAPSPPSSASKNSRVIRDGNNGRGRILSGGKSNKASAGDQRPAIWSDFYDESSAGPEPSIRFIDVPKTYSDESGAPDTARKALISTKEQILERSGEAEYLKVYEIDLRACNLTSIPNLDAFLRARSLDLSSNRLLIIEGLKYNKDIRDLKLYDNKISEVCGLESLTELSSLQLQHNQIKSIGSGLTHLKKLKQLRLDCNNILKLDAAELCGCIQLTYLDVSHNRIESIGAVMALPNLQELYVSDNCIRNLPDLSPCRKLEEVDLTSNKLTDVSGLKGCVSLTILRLSRNYLNRIDNLGSTSSLKDLYLDHNQICLLSPLVQLAPNLEVLDVSDNRVTSWTEVAELACLESLHELSVSGNPFCLPGGEKPSYHGEVANKFHSLRVLNKAMLQRSDTDRMICAPPMRPMSAAFAITSRQVESQLAVAEACLKDFEMSLEAKFSAVRHSVTSLPCRPDDSRPQTAQFGSRPASRRGARSRLMEARLFAEHNAGADADSF